MEKNSQFNEVYNVIYSTLTDNKAEDIAVIDLTHKTSIADMMVIASARSGRHLSALAQHLYFNLKSDVPLKIEGNEGSVWVVVDTFHVIVHLFTKEARDLYNLEKLWNVFSIHA